MANNKSKANLGKAWEDRIIQKCLDYRKENRAFIIKIPTEFTLIRGKMGKVVSAFPREKSILDFTGVLRDGQCLFIEAKSHNNKTSFSLNLIKPHQYDLAREILQYTDLCFYFVYFKALDKSYLVHTSQVETFMQENERKSIPISWFDKHGIVVDNDTFDFLTHIENYSNNN